jgi:general secretion pathway protein D
MTKATLKVGERIPTATGSYQPGVGAVGVNPLVNTQFSYTDVGVNMDVTPRVHDNGDVSMHLDMDISAQASSVTIGGITEPIFSQNHLIYDLRMHEGEIGLVGGLVNIQENKSVNGIPGLSSIPLLGRLFTTTSTDKQRSELMIALVPHIIRRPEFTAENLRSIGVGTGNAIHVSYGPNTADDAPPPSPVGQSRLDSPVPFTAPATPAVISPPAALAPGPAAPGPAAPGPPLPGGVPFPLQQLMRPGGAVPPTTAAPSQSVPPATARFVPATYQTSVNGAFSVALVLDGGADMVSASPVQIQYDPKVLTLTDVSPGDLFSRGGAAPVFTRNIQNDQGLATIQIARPAGVAGVAGPGAVVALNIVDVGPGSTTVSALNVTVRNSQAMSVGSSSPQLSVSVGTPNSNK